MPGFEATTLNESKIANVGKQATSLSPASEETRNNTHLNLMKQANNADRGRVARVGCLELDCRRPYTLNPKP